MEHFVRAFVTWREHSPEGEAAFDREARGYSVRVAELFCVAFLVFLPVYYAVDCWALDGAALYDSARWRIGVGLLLLLGWRVARHMRTSGRDAGAYAQGIAGGVAMCAIIGASTGPSAPLGSVTTSAYLVLPLLTIPMVSRLWLRCVATALVAAAVLGGYFIASPAGLRAPGSHYFVSVMGFVCLLSVAIGHALSLLVRRAFFLARRLADDARVLDERVKARTEEIRALLAHLVEAREVERARISREVHDELGQLLGGVALALDRARALPQGDEREAEMVRARALVGQAMDSARTVVSALRPRLLDDMGLAAGIEWLVRRHEEDTGAECEWSVELDPATLRPSQATTVFRVLQEALTNSARHAAAHNVTVRLDVVDADLRLEVSDDGRGFVPGRPEQQSFGLRGMEERARTLGGQVTVESAPGDGTRITLILPHPPETV